MVPPRGGGGLKHHDGPIYLSGFGMEMTEYSSPANPTGIKATKEGEKQVSLHGRLTVTLALHGNACVLFLSWSIPCLHYVIADRIVEFFGPLSYKELVHLTQTSTNLPGMAPFEAHSFRPASTRQSIRQVPTGDRIANQNTLPSVTYIFCIVTKPRQILSFTEVVDN